MKCDWRAFILIFEDSKNSSEKMKVWMEMLLKLQPIYEFEHVAASMFGS